MSLWDVFQEVDEGTFKGRRLVDIFAQLERNETKLTVAGKINTGDDVKNVLASGVDFVALGRAGILHHDWPQQFSQNPDFRSIQTPVSRAHLKAEGLGPKFVEYMSTWAGFVEQGT